MDTDEFIKKVAKMRSAQLIHAEKLQYGYRTVAMRAAEDVDKMLTDVLGDGWQKTAWTK